MSIGAPCGIPRARIQFTSTSFPASPTDWKGLFILRMLEALADREDLTISAWIPPGPLPKNVRRSSTIEDDKFLRMLMENGGISHLLRRRTTYGLVTAFNLLIRQRRALSKNSADLFHLNWLQNALSLPSDTTAALLTVLGTDMQLLRLPGMCTMLHRKFRDRAVAICPNAEWMLPELQAAFGDVASIHCVPFGIDASWYEIERRIDAEPIPKWLCVSRLTRGKLGSLFEWTEPAFAHGKAELHLFGPMQEQVELPSWVHWHGPATPDMLRNEWFPQAHGLITLSRHAEGRPQVMLEALAAGLPIIASRLPAHEDLLGDGGMLCDSASEALAAIDDLSDTVVNRALGMRGRARMHASIGTWADCAERYAAIYHQLLADRE